MIPKVLWIQTINPGVAYYRIYSFAKYMHDNKRISSVIFPEFNPKMIITPDWEGNLFKDSLDFIAPYVDWADLVICQYVSTPEGLSFIQGIRQFKKPCFMEIDDYVSQVPHYSCAYDQNKPGGRQEFWAIRQMAESDGVICSTQYLADSYIKYNSNVKVIQNCVNFDLWDSHEPIKHDLVRIGWIGGATHEGDLRLVKSVLYKLLDAYQNCEVYIVSAPPPDWPKHERLHLVSAWVMIDKYPGHVKALSFDIGIAPLRDNYFNRGKSNLRYLEYSACKIPTVASNVEPFKTNFYGLLANNEEDWFNHLSALIENEHKRKTIGSKSYEISKEQFNINRWSKTYSDFIHGALDGTFISECIGESTENRSYNIP